jgi:hypothetical protein
MFKPLLGPWIGLLVFAAAVVVAGGVVLAYDPGRVQFAVVGEDAQPLPCRIHLKNHLQQSCYPEQLPRWADHFVCPGNAELELPAGDYSFQIERGPEYQRASGDFHLAEGATKRVDVRLKRLADLAAEGWFSGDLHVHRPIEQMQLLMQAEDLHVAPIITWWNDKNLWKARRPPANLVTQFDGNRFFEVMGGEDEREGGALMFFGLTRPMAITGSSREYPSPMKFLQEARRHPDVWIDVEKPFWWDVPVWLAGGQIDSIGVANNHMWRHGVLDSEVWGKHRDTTRLPPPRGNGYWCQEIYYHVLNCGLRVPPSAGSASGVLPNPVGYDRVYVHLDGAMTYQKWWQALKAGRSFVTNGPLLLVQANERLPGHVFTVPEGEKVSIRLQARIISSDPISAVEIIQNGQVARRISPEQLASESGVSITFDRSGWFLVRTIADVPTTFRFASTAPYYVEIGGSKRLITRRSVQFFLDWLDERSARVPNKLHDPAQLEEVLRFHRSAREFWQKLLGDANAK